MLQYNGGSASGFPYTSTLTEWANGIRADVEGASARHCRRISSMHVLEQEPTKAPMGWYVEFGWMIGWECQYNVWNDTPKLFKAMRTPDLDYQCWDWGAAPGQGIDGPASGSFSELRLSDANSDGFWGTFKDGVEYDVVGRMEPGFHDGVAYLGGERDNWDDIPRAHFVNMKYIKDSTFISWTDQRMLYNLNCCEPNPVPTWSNEFYCREISTTEMWTDDSTSNPCTPRP